MSPRRPEILGQHRLRRVERDDHVNASTLVELQLLSPLRPRRGNQQEREPGQQQARLEQRHAGLHGVGRHQHLRHEQDAVAEVDTDNAHAFHQALGQDLVRSPAALKQDVHTFFDLFFQATSSISVPQLLETLLAFDNCHLLHNNCNVLLVSY